MNCTRVSRAQRVVAGIGLLLLARGAAAWGETLFSCPMEEPLAGRGAAGEAVAAAAAGPVGYTRGQRGHNLP